MSNSNRAEMIKQYYTNAGKVKVEIPATYSETNKGRIRYLFNGERCGYKFKDGIALVERTDLHKFQGFTHMIIHDENTKEGNE